MKTVKNKTIKKIKPHSSKSKVKPTIKMAKTEVVKMSAGEGCMPIR